jgi:hypothetical protein
MDITSEQSPPTKSSPPEQAVRPAPKPDVGAKRDLINPEKPEADEPRKPISDMDPNGSDPDENDAIN